MSPLVSAVLSLVGLLAAGLAVAVLVQVLLRGRPRSERRASEDPSLQAHQQAVRSQGGRFGPPAG